MLVQFDCSEPGVVEHRIVQPRLDAIERVSFAHDELATLVVPVAPRAKILAPWIPAKTVPLRDSSVSSGHPHQTSVATGAARRAAFAEETSPIGWSISNTS